MALNKTSLVNALVQVFTNQYEGELSTDQEQGIQNLSNEIANAVDAYVKTGTVTVSAGIAVQVTPATGTGSTIATGVGTIS